MTLQLGAIAIFLAVFALATWRRVHLGVVMLPVACAVGIWLAGMPLRDVLGGFPLGIMVLLVGVTYFFGIAQVNGAVDRVIAAVLARLRGRALALPLTFFALTAGISAMGSPLAGLVMAPLGMPLAKRHGMDPMLMALAIGSGFSIGGFAPTSLFGIVTYGTAQQAGIALNPLTLLAVAAGANVALLLAGFLLYGRQVLLARHAPVAGPAPRSAAAAPLPFARNQVVTLVAMLGLVAVVIGASLAGREPDVGVLCLGFGAALAFYDPRSGAAALSRIDWSTVLLVGGIVTYVGVLQKLGAVTMLGEAAGSIGAPILAALLICGIGGLASAFASTTGILAALVPLGIPLVASGGVAGWALISALAVCSSIVDVSPFSTVGATLIASADAEERPRITSLLTRWGLALVIIGPLVLVLLLVLPAGMAQ